MSHLGPIWTNLDAKRDILVSCRSLLCILINSRWLRKQKNYRTVILDNRHRCMNSHFIHPLYPFLVILKRRQLCACLSLLFSRVFFFQNFSSNEVKDIIILSPYKSCCLDQFPTSIPKYIIYSLIIVQPISAQKNKKNTKKNM